MNESATDILTALAESCSGVDMDAVLAGLETVDNTTDLDGTALRSLFHHHAAADGFILADKLDHGTAGAINRFTRAASNGDN